MILTRVLMTLAVLGSSLSAVAEDASTAAAPATDNNPQLSELTAACRLSYAVLNDTKSPEAYPSTSKLSPQQKKDRVKCKELIEEMYADAIKANPNIWNEFMIGGVIFWAPSVNGTPTGGFEYNFPNWMHIPKLFRRFDWRLVHGLGIFGERDEGSGKLDFRVKWVAQTSSTFIQGTPTEKLIEQARAAGGQAPENLTGAQSSDIQIADGGFTLILVPKGFHAEIQDNALLTPLREFAGRVKEDVYAVKISDLFMYTMKQVYHSQFGVLGETRSSTQSELQLNRTWAGGASINIPGPIGHTYGGEEGTAVFINFYKSYGKVRRSNWGFQLSHLFELIDFKRDLLGGK